MNAEIIQKKIDDFNYWDANVLSLSCTYFGDEVTLIYEDKKNGNVQYLFTDCYYINFQHNLNEKKIGPIKTLKSSQLPYFIHDVTIECTSYNNNDFYKCTLDISYMTLKILCKDITITRI